MKTYPSILGCDKNTPNSKCIAFYKYDGSNLRWEWSKKRGWYKFGTRNRLFDSTDEIFGEAISIFQNTYANDIERILIDSFRTESAIAFTEFLGPSSFAGLHIKDEPKELILFDISIYKKGLLSPVEFIKEFKSIKTAEVIYTGNLNQPFIQSVRENTDGKLNEGVVCKGGEGHKLWMRKIKTNSYLEKLKNRMPNDWQNYWE